MLKATELLTRFFQILILPQLSKPDRIKSQWTYLMSLFKNQSIETERIQAYLNIIQKTQTKRKDEILKQSPLNSPTPIIPKIKTNNFISTEQHQKSFSQYTNSLTLLKEQKKNSDESTANTLLNSINSLNKIFIVNNKYFEQQHEINKSKHNTNPPCNEQNSISQKLGRNNFRRQPLYRNQNSKMAIQTKRYSSSFKNRY